MKPYISWCPCRKEIAQTDGAVLIIGGMEIRRPVTLWCSCGGSTYWRPTKAREAQPGPRFEPICYTKLVEV